MTNSERIFINTVALYAKIILTSIISLILTRIVLNALGVNDYGIYNLIAGTIAFLSFINSALLTSSQRYLSVYKGKNDLILLKRYFSGSVTIHLILCVILLFIFEVAYFFVFDGFFNISPNRILSAKIVYQLTCISMIITVAGVPYSSVINSNEHLVFFSIVESLCAIAKLAVIFLFKIPGVNVLIVYSIWITIVSAVGVLAKFIWSSRYPECRGLKINIDKPIIKEMLSFSGWNCLGAFSMVCRSQGIAFVINIFWGTAINAVYGIANQVNGQLSYFSQMLSASFAPQIMKSAGENDFNRMRRLSVFSSKAAFLMSAIFAIPLLVNLNYILMIWLKNVPEYTYQFCSLIIYVFLILQLYPGLVRAILAVGRIKWYQITISILLIIPVFLGITLYKLKFPSYAICYAMIGAQLLSLISTVLFSRQLFGLNISKYFYFIFKAIGSYFAFLYLFDYINSSLQGYLNNILRFFLVSISAIISYISIYYVIMFDKQDKKNIRNLLNKILKK